MIISGRVQGVFFRYHTQEKAKTLGLKGWVRNTESGSVEVVAEGEQAVLEELLSWCRKGPPSASVSDVKSRWEEADGVFPDFKIVY